MKLRGLSAYLRKSSDTTWANCLAATPQTDVAIGDTSHIYTGKRFAAPTYRLWQSFLRFATNTIPAALGIDEATLRLYVHLDGSATDFDFALYMLPTPGYGTIDPTDWDMAGTMIGSLNSAAIQTDSDGYKYFDFRLSGASDIDLENPSFEDAISVGWRQFAYGVRYPAAWERFATIEARTGDNVAQVKLQLNSIHGGPTCYQGNVILTPIETPTLTPGQRYRLTCWIRQGASPAVGEFRLWYREPDTFPPTIDLATLTSAWQLCSIIFTHTPEAEPSFGLFGANCYVWTETGPYNGTEYPIYIDDMRLECLDAGVTSLSRTEPTEFRLDITEADPPAVPTGDAYIEFYGGANADTERRPCLTMVTINRQETIAEALETRLKAITTGNGYEYTVATVSRLPLPIASLPATAFPAIIFYNDNDARTRELGLNEVVEWRVSLACAIDSGDRANIGRDIKRLCQDVDKALEADIATTHVPLNLSYILEMRVERTRATEGYLVNDRRAFAIVDVLITYMRQLGEV